MNWRGSLYSSLDYIFPILEPLSKEEGARPGIRLQEWNDAIPLSEQLLDEFLTASELLLRIEHERRQGIEARLTSILGLSSIAGTVGFAGMFLGSGVASHIQSRPLRWILLVAGCYLILQICAAMLAAVRGLSRRSYESFTISDLIPSFGESRAAFLYRKATCSLKLLTDHDLQNNSKLSHLAMAHHALRNFLFGLIVFTLFGAVTFQGPSGGDDLAKTLKKDQELRELLRGPQGIPGPKGDPGASAAAPQPCSSVAPTGDRKPKDNKTGGF